MQHLLMIALVVTLTGCGGRKKRAIELDPTPHTPISEAEREETPANKLHLLFPEIITPDGFNQPLRFQIIARSDDQTNCPGEVNELFPAETKSADLTLSALCDHTVTVTLGIFDGSSISEVIYSNTADATRSIGREMLVAGSTYLPQMQVTDAGKALGFGESVQADDETNVEIVVALP